MKNFYNYVTIIILLFYSSLNAQWVRISDPIGGFYSLAASDTCIFAGNNNGRIYRSTDNGTTWNIVYYGSTGTRTDAIDVSGTTIFAANDAGVVRSSNNGTNWTIVGLTGTIYPQALAISDTNIFAGTYQSGIYRSTNNGTNWSAVDSGLTDSARFITALFALDTTNVYAGTWGRGAFRSTRSGAFWTPVNNGLTSNHVHAFTASHNQSGVNLFAGTYLGEGVYLSTDYGDSWTVVNNGLTTNKVRSLAVSDTNLFAGTDGEGVFHSTNNGANWFVFNEGFTVNVVNKLLVYNSNLYAGTENGIWRRPLSDITGIEDHNNRIPSRFILEQNYPNPFNPSTTIKYSIPTSEFVTIKVYDILGREVASLVNEQKTQGRYSVNFSASRLVSGVYFFRFHAGNFVETKKMILLK